MIDVRYVFIRRWIMVKFDAEDDIFIQLHGIVIDEDVDLEELYLCFISQKGEE